MLSLLLPAPVAYAALPGDQNKEPEVCQGVAGAAYTANEIGTYATPPPFDLPFEAGAYAGNWALKLCPPQVAAPADIKVDPDTPDSCEHTFHQRQTKAEYMNLLGIPFVLGDWGDLGTPSVYHFNTDVDIRLVDPNAPRGALEDHMAPGTIKLPVGRNGLLWRGDTLVSPLDFAFLYIPQIPPGSALFKKIVKASPKFGKKAVKSFNKVGELTNDVVFSPVGDVYIDEAIGINWRHSQIGVIDDVYNQDAQEVWVYDKVPPVISTNTDPSTFSDFVKPIVQVVDAPSHTYNLEAFQPGGIARLEALNFARALLTYSDHCDRSVTVRNSRVPDFWTVGSTVTVTWTASDPGPRNAAGDPNTATVTQTFVVRDTKPPILLTPPSKVVEVPQGTTTADVPLGAPRVFDLVNLDSHVANDHPDTLFDLGLTEVLWTADDGANATEATQLINVKVEGANAAPSGDNQTVDAISFEPIDIILTGADADYHASVDRFDPLTFTIETDPLHGFFVAPLLPYFIDDYRLEASALRFAGEPEQVDPFQYCKDLRQGLVSGPSNWQLKYPANADWISVDDDGTTVVYDQGSKNCDPSGDLGSQSRLAVFAPDGTLLHAITANSTYTDVYIDHLTKQIYVTDVSSPGQGELIFYDEQLNRLGAVDLDSGTGTTTILPDPKFSAVDHQGVLYAGQGYGSVRAYVQPFATYPGQRWASDDLYLGDLATAQSDLRSVAIDADNNVYISKRYRIDKYAAGTFDAGGHFTPGALIGWMGKCTGNLTNQIACDTQNQRSFGFACSDALCGGNGAGNEAGQFDDARGIAIDPNDILYVSDYANARVQRFTPDGFFAGEADSQGVGYGFILGDFGNPEDITVNSDHFYILNRDLLHVFETTPITPIDDGSAKVTYQSANNYVGSDQFAFRVSDGLTRDDDIAFVTVDVARNHRPPEINVAPPPQMVNEDGSLPIILTGGDPDGALDTLSYVLVEPPSHGTVTGSGLDVVYTPDPNFAGSDTFLYAVSDGQLQSDPAAVTVTVDPVPDPPEVTVEPEIGAGVGFTFPYDVQVFDPDAGDTHRIDIDWGDGTSETDGAVVRNGELVGGDVIQPDGTIPDDVDTTGPIFSIGPGGSGIFSTHHTYTATGVYTVQACATDNVDVADDGSKQPTASSVQRCATTDVTVSESIDLSIQAMVDPEEVAPGGNAAFTFTLTNKAFDEPVPGIPVGRDATGVVLTAEAGRGLVVTGAAASQGNCTISGPDVTCDVGSLPYGDSATIDLATAVDDLAPGNAYLSVAAEATADQPDPTETTGAAATFVTPSTAPPSAAGVTPASGTAAGGTVITVTGRDFQDGAVVTIGGLPAYQVDVVDATRIQATTPPHAAGAVDVMITNPDGESDALAQAFSFAAESGGGGSGGGDGGTGGTGGGGSGTGGGGTTDTGGGGGGGGCAVSPDAGFDPALPLLLFGPVATLWLRRRIRSMGTRPTMHRRRVGHLR